MFKDLAAAFNLRLMSEPKPIGSGLINKTFLAETQEGKFILQSIHAIVPDGAIEDMRVVTDFLSERGFAVPHLRVSREGKYLLQDAKGMRWRVYPFVPGQVVDTITDVQMAREAGKLIGSIHAELKNLSYVPQGGIPHFHDTAFILGELASVKDQLPEDVQTEAGIITNQLPALIDRIIEEPRQLIHGDLKISNLLFDSAGKAMGVIDFDTILLHTVAVDMGDAYRSWCNKTSEDDGRAVFDQVIFDAAFTGYEEGSGRKQDRSVHLMGAKMIALELAARFLIDVVRDRYFGFDVSKYPTRRLANIARAKGQTQLAQTIPV